MTYAPKQPRVGWSREVKRTAYWLALVLVVGLNQATLRLDARTIERRKAKQAALDRVVGELSGYVAAKHQRPFKRSVPASLLGEAAFLDALFDDPEEETDDESADPTDDWGATLLALGLVPAGDDPAETDSEIEAQTVVGFYDLDEHRLFVRGTTITPYVRLVLVHELTHAWQDQWYGLSALYDAPTDDAWRAAQSLVEGDATRIEEDWRALDRSAGAARGSGAVARVRRAQGRATGKEPSVAIGLACVAIVGAVVLAFVG